MSSAVGPEVAGLRRRLSSLKTQTVDGARLPDMQAIREAGCKPDHPAGKGDEEDEEEESLTNSYSSHSSSASVRSDDTEHAQNINMAEATAEDIHSSPRPSINNTHHSRSHSNHASRRSQRHELEDDVAHDSSARWFGYDLSIIVAMVSPVGNLLTGSDHIKNIFLLLLLIYYLHQLVEVPWTLYRMSIPARHIPPIPPKEVSAAYAALSAAHAELRGLEIFYLILTVLSPFLGASLLRYVATAITGRSDTLSWFSTSLFVLATGVRPWSHLVERLKSRSQALNDILREQELHNASRDKTADVISRIEDLESHVLSVDKCFNRLEAESAEGIADMLTAIESALKRQKSDFTRTIQAQSERIAILEAQLRIMDVTVSRVQQLRNESSWSSLVHLLPFPISTVWMKFKGVGKPLPSPRSKQRRITTSPGSKSTGSRDLETINEEETTESEISLASSISQARKSRELGVIGVVKNVILAMITILLSPAVFVIRASSYVLGIPRNVD